MVRRKESEQKQLHANNNGDLPAPLVDEVASFSFLFEDPKEEVSAVIAR